MHEASWTANQVLAKVRGVEDGGCAESGGCGGGGRDRCVDLRLSPQVGHKVTE